MSMVVVGIDLGKTWCSVTAVDESGRVVRQLKRVRRSKLMEQLAQLPICLIAMEACCGAHHLARSLSALGHRVRLLAPHHVKPYRTGQKNDWRDSEAIAEAATRAKVPSVAVKSEAQLDLQNLHRMRERLVAERTGVINQIRGFLQERGIFVAQRPEKLAAFLATELAEGQVSARMMACIAELREEWLALNERIRALDREFQDLAKSNETCARLLEIPGIGPLTSTAILASVGPAPACNLGRSFAAWLGLVPKQKSTGGKDRLGAITKRGDSYLRKLLIHGARAAMPSLLRKDTRLGAWLRGVKERRGYNRAVVALANKMARICWALLSKGTFYQAEMRPAS